MTDIATEQQALAEYQRLLRQAVEEALDTPSLYSHGTLYQDDMKDFVRGKLGDLDGVKENFLGTIPIFGVSAELCRPHTDQLKELPRGSWLIYDKQYEHRPGEHFYCPRISAGGGKLGGHSDTYEYPPSFEKVRDRMVGYEIYSMRDTIEKERALAANQKAIKDFGFTPGQTFKNIKFSRDQSFSTLSVSEVSEGASLVEIQGRKRGSSNTWTGLVAGIGMEAALKKAGYAPANMESPEAALEWMGFKLDYSDGILMGVTRPGSFEMEVFSAVDNFAGMPKPAKELMIQARNNPTFNPTQAIKLVADTLEKLDSSDLYRLFEANDQANYTALSDFIFEGRPELREELAIVQAELSEDSPMFTLR